RAYWSGNIRLALVNIPVQLFAATRSGAQVSFHQIHKPSGKRIRYQKVVPGIGPVDTDDIVKGYEVDKGRYVLLSDGELDEIRLEARKTIDLVQFVKRGEIDPIYFEKPYFVAPDEESDGEAYVVLRDSLRKTGMTGIGQMVVRGRSHLVALKPCHQGLVAETLRYADEIRKSRSFFAGVPDIEPEKELTDLAEELIGRKAGRFDPDIFKDKYTEAVRELIDARLEDREPEEIEAPQAGAQVIDLMEALKRSVKGRGAASGTSKPSKAKSASKSSARKSSGKGSKKKKAA
ncbi:MAG: Ku protein, partial [Hyphomicrobiales bacterium]